MADFGKEILEAQIARENLDKMREEFGKQKTELIVMETSQRIFGEGLQNNDTYICTAEDFLGNEFIDKEKMQEGPILPEELKKLLISFGVDIEKLEIGLRFKRESFETSEFTYKWSSKATRFEFGVNVIGINSRDRFEIIVFCEEQEKPAYYITFQVFSPNARTVNIGTVTRAPKEENKTGKNPSTEIMKLMNNYNAIGESLRGLDRMDERKREKLIAKRKKISEKIADWKKFQYSEVAHFIFNITTPKIEDKKGN
jgi:hypothetical protein